MQVLRENEDYIFIVKDNGVGIPLNVQEKIGWFLGIQEEEFSLEKTGFGIGLSLTRKVVEMMKGHLEINS